MPSSVQARFVCVSLLMHSGCARELVVARELDVGIGGDAPRFDPCAPASPDWLLCSGFEEGSLARWVDLDGNPASTNQLLADPGPHARAGNHVARLSPLPGADSGADLVAELPPTEGPIWARWYAYAEPGFDFTVGQRGAGFHGGARSLLGSAGSRPNGSDWYTVLFTTDNTGQHILSSYYPGMTQDCAPPVYCNGDRLPCVTCDLPADQPQRARTLAIAGRWTCIEMMIDPGAPTPTAAAATGTMNAWVDGNELGPFTDRWFRSDAALLPTWLWLNLYFRDEHSDAGMRIDDVLIATRRIGC